MNYAILCARYHLNALLSSLESLQVSPQSVSWRDIFVTTLDKIVHGRKDHHEPEKQHSPIHCGGRRWRHAGKEGEDKQRNQPA